MAVIVRKGNQSYIQQANKPAQELGITAHQPLASAMALFPGLVVVEQDLNEEMKALREAAYAALRFTPNIVLQDSGLIAEVSASLKLFGGLKKLCQLLNRAVTVQGLQILYRRGLHCQGGMAARAVRASSNRRQWNRRQASSIARCSARRSAGFGPAPS